MEDDAPKRQRTAPPAPAPASAVLPAVAAPIAIDLPAAEEAHAAAEEAHAAAEECDKEEAHAAAGEEAAAAAEEEAAAPKRQRTLSARAQVRVLLAGRPPCPPRLVAGHGRLIARGQAVGAARLVWAAGGAAGRAETAVLRKQQLAEAGSLREQLAEAGSTIDRLAAAVRGLDAAGQQLHNALLLAPNDDDDADAECCECCGTEVQGRG